jgi:hypothetical protein
VKEIAQRQSTEDRSHFLAYHVDWFIPPNLMNDVDMRKQARIFLYSCIFGPFIGNTVPLALYYFDPKPGLQVAVLAAAITGFRIFPFVLRAFGHYYLLATGAVPHAGHGRPYAAEHR